MQQYHHHHEQQQQQQLYSHVPFYKCQQTELLVNNFFKLYWDREISYVQV
jgi:hypothetical protein